jgi:two-component system, cell cycle response regulator
MPTRKEVFDELNRTKKLPSPSGTTLKVIQLCNDEKTSLNDIARVIQTDPALSAELLKYANAAFLSTGIQVASVQKAAIKLGMRTVVNLALGISLLSNNKHGKCRTFDYERFWSLSLLQAIAARNFTGSGKGFDPEEIFICALLSHMGQLALASLFPQEYGDILNEFESCGVWGLTRAQEILSDKPSSLLCKTLEKDRFQIDSSELTVELFLNWGLPAYYALAAGFHDDLNDAELGSGTTQKIAKLLNLSHQLAQLCLDEQPTRQQLLDIEETARKFDRDKENFGTIFDIIISQWQDWGEIFKIQTRQCLHYDEIMAEKNENR